MCACCKLINNGCCVIVIFFLIRNYLIRRHVNACQWLISLDFPISAPNVLYVQMYNLIDYVERNIQCLNQFPSPVNRGATLSASETSQSLGWNRGEAPEIIDARWWRICCSSIETVTAIVTAITTTITSERLKSTRGTSRCSKSSKQLSFLTHYCSVHSHHMLRIDL